MSKRYTTNFLVDTNGNTGASGQVLVSTSTGVNWADGSDISGGPYLPLSAGSGFPLTGALTVSTTTTPQIIAEYNSNNKTALRYDGVDTISGGNGAYRVAGVTQLTLSGTGAIVTGTLAVSGSGDSYFTGNLGIGITVPPKTLSLEWDSSSVDVNAGEGLGGGTAGKGLLLRNSNTTAGTFANLDFRVNTADGRIAYTYNATNDGDFHFITDPSLSTKLFIKSNGDVGIGTVDPDAKLEVVGNILASSSGNSQVTLTSGGTCVLDLLNAQSEAYIRTTTAHDLHFRTTNINRMVVKAGGDIGIGTTSPTSVTEIQRIESTNRTTYSDILTISARATTVPYNGHGGGILLKGSNYQNNNANVNYARIGSTISSNSNFAYGSDLFFDIAPLSDGVLSRAMTINYDKKVILVGTLAVQGTGDSYFTGDLGIGLTLPTAKLHISGDNSTASAIRILKLGGGTSVDGNGQYIQFSSSGNDSLGSQIAGTRVGTGASSDLRFSTTSGTSVVVERMRIDEDGDVGIGTEDPNRKLHVIGQVAIENAVSSTGALLISTDSSSNKIYSRTANSVTGAHPIDFIQTSSVVMRINSNGNIGINTTSPYTKLTLNNGVARTTTTKAYSTFFHSNDTDDYRFGLVTALKGGAASANRYASIDSASYRLSTAAYSGGEDLILQSLGGKVGINTLDPNGRLQVTQAQETVAFTNPFLRLHPSATTDLTGVTSITMGTSTVTNYGVSLNAWRYSSASGDPKFALRMHNNSAAGINAIVIDSAGKVGIGTDIPNTLLYVNGSSGGYLATIRNNTAGGDYLQMIAETGDSVFRFASGGTGGEALMYMHKDGVVKNLFDANGNSYITGGNLGVGTTTPTAANFQVSGTSQLSGSVRLLNLMGVAGEWDASALKVDSANTVDSTGWQGIRFATSTANNYGWSVGANRSGSGRGTFRIYENPGAVGGTNHLSILQSTGYTGIGNPAPSYKLDVSGTIRATGDVIAYSDARVKESVETIENALDKVTQLRGVSYTRNDIEDKSTKIGVIAQEILKVIPEVVQQDDKGRYSVAYGNIVGLLIESIKELKAEVDELKSRI